MAGLSTSRRRGAGRRFLVAGDVLDGVIVGTTASAELRDDARAVIRTRPDGAGANVAAWLGWLGADVDFVGRVGIDDVYRHERALADAGVRPHILYDRAAPTGIVVTAHDGEARVTMLDPGASDALRPEDIEAELVRAAHVVHLSGDALLADASPASIASVVADVQASDGRVGVGAPSVGAIRRSGSEPFLSSVSGADALVTASDRACALAGVDDPIAAAASLVQRLPLVVLSCGLDGGIVARPGRTPQRVQAVPIESVDPVGADDAFTAGFLRAWATDAVRVGAAAREGVRVAARARAVVGGRPTI
jgi:sugar/nucleoside kinase (ribokinase family)